MAVTEHDVKPVSGGKRFLVGTNVAVAVVLAAAVVGVAQAIVYPMASARWDMTSSGVNSLGDGTTNLLRALDTNIRLTSLYFETDREEEDQRRYRQAAKNLLDLYEAANRSKVTADWINPLKDREAYQKLTQRFRELPAYKSEVETYKAFVEEYKTKYDEQMRAFVQGELSAIGALGLGIGGAPSGAAQVIAPLENVFTQWTSELPSTREQVDALTNADNPQYGAAVNEMEGLYRKFAKTVKDAGKFATDQIAANKSLAAPQAEYLRDLGTRGAALAAELDALAGKFQNLEPIKVEDLLIQMGPTANAIVVESSEDAKVIDFSTCWPATDPNNTGRTRFDQRAFKGEEKVTSAILRATHKQQTAVVFVRYGGAPLLMGGFMPGQPPAPYATMKQQLEDANFAVEEWDLKAGDAPPPIDPAPTRTLYVVLKPNPPARGQMGQPAQEPPFGEAQRKALLSALGDKGRALFIVGWAPGPFGPIPSSYEYADYLKNIWGVTVDTSNLLINFTSTEPGKYGVTRRDFFNLDKLQVTDHPIVQGAQARQLALPWCAPLKIADASPEGVSVERLVSQPQRDGLWGVQNIQKYEEQMNEKGFLTKEADDSEGPFDLAVAATKGEAKIVVVSSREFAVDQWAFAREMGLGPQGLIIRSRNPGNVTLLVNSLHWLNDNTEFMNVGKPIDSAVLQIPGESTEKIVKALTIFVWPALALCCGGAVWWVRRR